MTKQEELEKGADEVILKCLKDGWIKPYEIRSFVFKYLHSQGVVIKRGYKVSFSTSMPAGTELVAVEPLIKEDTNETNKGTTVHTGKDNS